MKNGERTHYMKVARAREAQYAEIPLHEEGQIGNKPSFTKWLRGKFGATFAQRHLNAKPADEKVGAPFTRVQHRTGMTAMRKRT
jgi:hypothetical protein